MNILSLNLLYRRSLSGKCNIRKFGSLLLHSLGNRGFHCIGSKGCSTYTVYLWSLSIKNPFCDNRNRSIVYNGTFMMGNYIYLLHLSIGYCNLQLQFSSKTTAITLKNARSSLLLFRFFLCGFCHSGSFCCCALCHSSFCCTFCCCCS